MDPHEQSSLLYLGWRPDMTLRMIYGARKISQNDILNGKGLRPPGREDMRRWCSGEHDLLNSLDRG